MYKKLLTKKYIISVVVLAVMVGGIFFFTKTKKSNYEFAIVQRTDLTQEVSVTGKVEPADKVDLAFNSEGRVSNIYVNVGDEVYRGQMLARLNSAQYSAQYLQSQASLEAEKAKLEELEKGTRPEEIDIQETKVKNAEELLADAKNNLKNYIKDAYTKSDDAIRNQVDQFFINPRSTNPQLTFESGYKLQIESQRLVMENILTDWANNVVTSKIANSNLDNQYSLAKNNLSKIGSFLDVVALAVNGLNVNSSLSQALIDSYKSDISVARTNINNAINNLSMAREKLITAETTFTIAQQELILKEKGPTMEQISAQKARVKSAEANVNNFRALIGKTIIYSPIRGIITKKNIEVGEIVHSNTPIISIMSTSKYEIKANIPEADIAKVKVGDKANVTLDAYEDDVFFPSTVTFIDPAETIIENVSAYKTTFQFDKKDKRIKSGMTANIDIMTNSRKNVLAVSYRALRTGGGNNVEVLNDNNEIEIKKVKVGMRSSDGRVEIISGLKEGDRVITSK